jgi:hypothetical protein
MELAKALDQFAVRLMEWSLQAFIRELDEGCPLLSLVGLNNYSVAGFVSWVGTLSAAEREAFARAQIRYAHEHAAMLCGVPLTKEERDYWNHKFYMGVTTHKDLLPPFINADYRLPTFKPVNPDNCLNILLSSLSPALGKAVRRKSKVYAWRQIGDWKLISEFTFSRREMDLCVEYQFVRKDGSPVIGHGGLFPRNPFMFYGVWATVVDVPSEADNEPMAKAMATVAAHFAAQADPLFAGLNIKD